MEGAQPGTGGSSGIGGTTLAGPSPAAGGGGGRQGTEGGSAVSGGAPASADAGLPVSGLAGDSGAGGAGPAGGDPTYNPCPSTGPCAIMPLGDSITAGTGSSDGGGYRVELFRLAVTHGQSVTFVGRSASGPTMVGGMPFPRSHEGHSGYLIDTGPQRPGLMPILDAIFAAATPHVVLLMIGTNDIPWMLDLPNEPKRLGLLIDKIASLAPKALVVVAQIGPSSMDDRTALIKAYNDGIPEVVQERATAGQHVIMVDMFTPFVSNPNYRTALLSDEVHPNDAGYVILGQTWYTALSSVLPRAN